MTTLYFCVWDSAAAVANGDPIQEGTVDISTGSKKSDVIVGDNRKRRRVRIFCDANAFVTWGADPTATNDGLSGRPMGSENPEYFDIEAGHQIAVIERT